MLQQLSLANLIRRIRSHEDGVTALEYALIAALIAVAIIAGVRTAGQNVSQTFTTVSSQMPAH